ncbi:hypothetical protein ACMG4H_14240 [Corynebacterium glutamicum]|uniref:hypothetical protein n=1 Tax=Corynebacterium glutamicum TaxID=1718 RepID=UPI003C79ABAF
MSEDQDEANRILREWITAKTGTTDAERAMWKFATTWEIIQEKIQAPIAHVMDVLAQASPSRGVEE